MPRKFIDKKKAATFHLVHRSQRDPLVNDPESSSRVLKYVPAPNTKVLLLSRHVLTIRLIPARHLKKILMSKTLGQMRVKRPNTVYILTIRTMITCSTFVRSDRSPMRFSLRAPPIVKANRKKLSLERR